MDDVSQLLPAARWAVARWVDFPAGARPRPVVFVGSAMSPTEGFRSAEAKSAFLAGRLGGIELPAAVAVVVERATEMPDRQNLSDPRLEVTAVAPGEAEFTTDRGPRVLPAWRLTGPEIVDCIWVADPAVAIDSWPKPEQPPQPEGLVGTRVIDSAALGDAPTELVVYFTGGPPEQWQYPDGEVVESDAAVAAIPRQRSTGRAQPDGWHVPVGIRRHVRVRLAAPLGGRVLVDLDGQPVVVWP